MKHSSRLGRSKLPVAVMTLALLIALVAACTSTDRSVDYTSGTRSDGKRSSTTLVATGGEATLDRYKGYRSDVYSQHESWLCRPDKSDVCDRGLDATVVGADGTLKLEKWRASKEPPVDCFYVYPTISQDPTTYSDMNASDGQEGFAALNQVARLGSECRVFAPIYRQRTLAGLAGVLAGSTPTTSTVASDQTELNNDTSYTDVLDAWKSYMAHDNHGRGVVLVGHSQGAAILNRLIRDEIDPNEDVRDHLVAAYLAGWAVEVPEGADVGGDFKNVPLCRTADALHCVVTWASFRSTQPPPPDALFGRPATDSFGNKLVAACNSPAAPRGGPGEAISYFPASPDASILSALGANTGGMTSWVDQTVGTVSTPFVTTPGLVTVECQTANDINYQAITVNADTSDPRADDIGGDLTPQWGMHLQDVNIVMGNILQMVTEQANFYTGGG